MAQTFFNEMTAEEHKASLEYANNFLMEERFQRRGYNRTATAYNALADNKYASAIKLHSAFAWLNAKTFKAPYIKDEDFKISDEKRAIFDINKQMNDLEDSLNKAGAKLDDKNDAVSSQKEKLNNQFLKNRVLLNNLIGNTEKNNMPADAEAFIALANKLSVSTNLNDSEKASIRTLYGVADQNGTLNAVGDFENADINKNEEKYKQVALSDMRIIGQKFGKKLNNDQFEAVHDTYYNNRLLNEAKNSTDNVGTEYQAFEQNAIAQMNQLYVDKIEAGHAAIIADQEAELNAEPEERRNGWSPKLGMERFKTWKDGLKMPTMPKLSMPSIKMPQMKTPAFLSKTKEYFANLSPHKIAVGALGLLTIASIVLIKNIKPYQNKAASAVVKKAPATQSVLGTLIKNTAAETPQAEAPAIAKTQQVKKHVEKKVAPKAAVEHVAVLVADTSQKIAAIDTTAIASVKTASVDTLGVQQQTELKAYLEALKADGIEISAEEVAQIQPKAGQTKLDVIKILTTPAADPVAVSKQPDSAAKSISWKEAVVIADTIAKAPVKKASPVVTKKAVIETAPIVQKTAVLAKDTVAQQTSNVKADIVKQEKVVDKSSVVKSMVNELPTLPQPHEVKVLTKEQIKVQKMTQQIEENRLKLEQMDKDGFHGTKEYRKTQKKADELERKRAPLIGGPESVSLITPAVKDNVVHIQQEAVANGMTITTPAAIEKPSPTAINAFKMNMSSTGAKAFQYNYTVTPKR